MPNSVAINILVIWVMISLLAAAFWLLSQPEQPPVNGQNVGSLHAGQPQTKAAPSED